MNTRVSTITGNTSRTIERHLGSSYKTILYIAGRIPWLEEFIVAIDDYLGGYLGDYDEAPTETPTGEPLEVGMYFINNVDNHMYFYTPDGGWYSIQQSVEDGKQELSDEVVTQLAVLESATVDHVLTLDTTASAHIATMQGILDAVTVLAGEVETDAALVAQAALDTAADRIQTGLDRDATEADRIQTGLDVISTSADRTQTNLDKLQTEADVVASLDYKNQAAASAQAAEQAFDNFDDKYLGAKVTPPTLDNDGDALQVGATYWHSIEELLYYWNGAEWESPDKSASASAANAANSASNALTSEGNAETAEVSVLASEARVVTLEASATASALSASEDAATASAVVTGLVARGNINTPLAESIAHALNNERYAASGFTHFGKHRIENATFIHINEGMMTILNVPNSLVMGRRETQITGTSKTDEPVINIAGSVVSLVNMNRSPLSTLISDIRFEEAPNGTVTYDSATGTVVDLTKDIDPKYGDVAGTINEAKSRAFEGDVRNGNFRDGETSWIYDSSATSLALSNNQATLTKLTSEGENQALNTVVNNQQNSTYVVGVFVHSFTGTVPRVLGQSTSLSIFQPLSLGYNRFEFTSLNAALFIGVRGSAGLGDTVTFSNFSCRLKSNEVVINRYDFAFLEYWLEEITPAQPFVYDRGIVQSQATEIAGIPTVPDTRPITYSAVYEGDTSSRGRGIDWFALSDAQRGTVASDPKQNITYDSVSDKWYQRRPRQREVGGAGNGNWTNVDVSVTGDAWLNYDGFKFALPQGAKDTPNTAIADGIYVGINSGSSYKHDILGDKGIFTAGKAGGGNISEDNAVNGECYALPLCIKAGLNDGAYHPSFNPMGTALVRNITTPPFGSTWYATDNKLNTTSEAFIDYPEGKRHVGSGDIASTISGRPDNKFYDAVYASGQGGVIDLRLAASESDTPPNVIDGTLRGVENLVWTQIDVTTQTANASTNEFSITDSSKYAVGDAVIIVNSTDAFDVIAKIVSVSPSTIVVDKTFNRAVGTSHVVIEHELNQAVEGEYLHVDVFGVPVRIAACAALRDGWLGSWIHVFGSSGSPLIDVPFTRRVLNPTDIPRVFTVNDGVTWVSSTAAYNQVTNSYQNSPSETYIGIYSYTTSARITEPSSNREVFRGAKGLGDIVITSDYRPEHGALFAESVADLILKSDAGSVNRESVTVNRYLLTDTLDSMSHLTTLMPVPTNDSQGVKVVCYELEVNGQLFLGFVANTMTYSTGDSSWGDTGNMFIPSGESSTFTDTNGTEQIARVEILNKPYGWVRNDI